MEQTLFQFEWPAPSTKQQKDAARVRAYVDSFRGRMNLLVRGAKATAKVKKLEFDLTQEHVSDLWQTQKGLCRYTGLVMSTLTGSDNLVSIERQDSNLGYTKSNCVLVCWTANRAKNNLSMSQFVALCRAVVAQADGTELPTT